MIAADAAKDFGELGDAHAAVFKPVGNTPACTLFGGTLIQPWMKVLPRAGCGANDAKGTAGHACLYPAPVRGLRGASAFQSL